MAPLYVRDRQEMEHLLVTMHAQGWTMRALCRYFKIGRNTVRRIVRKNKARRDGGHSLLVSKLPRGSKLDAFLPRIKELLAAYPNITGVRLFEELRETGYRGGISILRGCLRSLRRKPKRNPIIRFETDPGVQGQMDWSPYTINFKQGGKATVLCFSYILAFSRRHYIDFTLQRDFFTLIRRHRDAFEYFGGLPRQCLYDNEKTVVLRWEAGRPVFNPAFIAFITHYQCRPIACRPGHPETKGKIEAPFLFVEKNLLNARDFQDLEHLRATARWWLREKSDPHRHDTTGRVVIELFEEQEKDALLPLPAHPYDCSEVALRVCSAEGFIEFETNFYSVPFAFIADILAFKATEREVFIYSPELKLIARHERHPAGEAKRVEEPGHHLTPQSRYGLEPVREAFLALGEAAPDFLAGLKHRNPHHCGFHARFILRLKEYYYADDIHAALRHALRYQAYDGKAIERILKARATPRPLESHRVEQARAVLQKVLPKITQRELSEYCQLFSKNKDEPHG